MFKFSDLKILTKILWLLGLLALVSLGATILSANKIRYIDSTYNDLFSSSVKAPLAISHANHALVYIDRALYRLTTETTDEAKKASVKDITEMQNYFDKQMKMAGKAMPAAEEDIKHINSNVAALLSGVCAETIRLGSSINADDTKNAGVSMREKCDPALLESMEDITKLTNSMVKMNDEFFGAAADLSNTTTKNMCLLILSGLFIIMFLAIFITESNISKPIKEITDALHELSTGNLDAEIEGSERGDELGDIAKAALVFRDQGKETRRLRAEQDQTKIQAELDRKQMLETLARDFESGIQGIINTVTSASTELYQTAESMQKAIANVFEHSETVTSASAGAMENVETVAVAVEEMSSSVKEISSQVTKTFSLMGDAVSKTETADSASKLLSSAVVEISKILDMIETIASQINLLALNATIEAARAGDAGRGFAVVASEVKSLAGQTSKATETIADQINNIKNVSDEVVQALSDIQAAINTANQYTGGIAAAVEEQSTATSEISVNMQSASLEVHSITVSMRDVSKEADAAEHAAKEVLGAAKMLSKQSEILNQQVNLFLAHVRA